MKKFNQKLLSATVSMMMTVTLCKVATTHASDIEIYKLPDNSKITLFMMFDTSGSMGVGYGYDSVSGANDASSLVGDYGVCSWSSGSNSSIKTELQTYKVGSRAQKTYNVNYCDVTSSTYGGLNSTFKTRIQNECVVTGTNAYKCYDRLSRLKMALAKVLSSNEISNNVRIGLGQFSTPPTDPVSVSTSQRTGGLSFSHDGRSGRIIYPVVPLTEANREVLIDTMVGLSAYNGTPSASAYGEAGAYMLGANTYPYRNNYSGYSSSISTSKNGTSGYIAPLTTAEMSNTCNGQGVYFLTDGFANNSDTSSTTNIMKASVGSLSGTGLPSPASNSTASWPEIGKFSQMLRANNRNIKTAIVGFGKDFPNGNPYVKDLPVDILDQDGAIVETVSRRFYDCSALPDGDVKNTCNWGAKPHSQLPSTVGGFGNGGFYSAKSTQDIVDSIKYFVDDIKPRFKPVATGSPTIPIDQLNPVQIQPYGYYAQFTPKPQENYQLWLGNLNKYYTKDGELKGGGNIALIQASGKLNQSAVGIWGTSGMLGQIPLGTGISSDGSKYSKRQVLTNRTINSSNVAIESSDLINVSLKTLFGTDPNTAKLVNDPKKNYWLNVLGYSVPITATNLTVDTLPTSEIRQVGATMHSTPLLLTQAGKVNVQADGTVTSSNREDYVLYGSTQGILHVVKADKDDTTNTTGGQEVFAFVPHEIMEKQAQGFLSEGNTTGGRANLYYGMDGAWTAFTQYVTKADGSLTIKDSDRTDLANTNNKGMQWVYGGMRMGGQSYYALDLADISNPKLKFHIDPSTATSGPLSFMGKSWSKPTITYVKWNGVRTRVMFVGGGYDDGYEAPDYEQANKKGAGVYMFDATTGSLLWWASANATSGSAATANADLKYSVVSQINAVDRDSDGLSDTLYFGDLGGQAFRIDLNNQASSTSNFATRVVALYKGHISGGLSPRFYEMPSFSVQNNGKDGLYGILALSSGNRSSPLAGKYTDSSNNVTTTVSAKDGVFVIFDNDIARSDLYTLATTDLRTQNITSLNTLTLATGVTQTSGTDESQVYNGGWVYYYPTSESSIAYGNGHIKGMNELYALDSMLYVNAYNKDGVGINGSCNSGVIGDSYLYQFCLPSGKCDFYSSSTTDPNRVKLGGGILGTGLGQAYSGGGMGLIVKREGGSDCKVAANKNLPECQLFSAKVKLQHLRWYESR